MNNKSQPNVFRTLRSENGAVLVVSMLMLVVLTIIGIAAMNTSILEILISNSHKKRQAAFYAAEAGVEHAKAVMTEMLVDNADSTSAGVGTVAEWDFIFDDTTNYPTVSESSEFKHPLTTRESFLFQNKPFGSYTYTVTMGDATNSKPGILWVRSTGVGPRGERVVLEVSYQGQFVESTSGQNISDYGGQSHKGGDKASSGEDSAAIGQGNLTSALHGQSV